ncbi:MAG: class I SAM-dependent methyltransferase [Solirubrobacterales bacterium]
MQLDEETGLPRAARLGRSLRLVPGMPTLLDVRVRRLERRAEAAERERVEARRARDSARLHQLGEGGGLRLNVGCGPGTLDGWVNVDLVTIPEGVLYMDVTRPWPLPDGSAAAVNSEHFVEHVEHDDVRAYLREAARVLAPGGAIRTSTPSLRGVIDAYLEADSEMLAAYREDVRGWCDAANHAEMLNNTFYEWGHRHIYDYESLAELLAEAGFESIEPAEFGHSRHPALRGIDIHDAGERLRSLVVAVDAVRP